jgi:hypothetical protein
MYAKLLQPWNHCIDFSMIKPVGYFNPSRKFTKIKGVLVSSTGLSGSHSIVFLIRIPPT